MESVHEAMTPATDHPLSLRGACLLCYTCRLHHGSALRNFRGTQPACSHLDPSTVVSSRPSDPHRSASVAKLNRKCTSSQITPPKFTSSTAQQVTVKGARFCHAVFQTTFRAHRASDSTSSNDLKQSPTGHFHDMPDGPYKTPQHLFMPSFHRDQLVPDAGHTTTKCIKARSSSLQSSRHSAEMKRSACWFVFSADCASSEIPISC